MLPPGLSINPTTGVISGTPTFGGHYIVAIRADNIKGASAERYEMDITHPQMPVITTVTLPHAEIASSYSATLSATGATPITWSSTPLPQGITLSSAGVLSGTPAATGSYTFEVTASNAHGSDRKMLSLTVMGTLKPAITTPMELPSGSCALPLVTYQYQLSATGAQPITWSVIDGALPVGMTLTPEGKLIGRVLEPGSFTFWIKATNAYGESDPKQFYVIINGSDKPIFVWAGELPDAYPGQQYSYQIEITGKRPLTTVQETGEPLPVGIYLSPSGLIYGTPIGPGVSIFRVIAIGTDRVVSQPFTLHVVNTDPNTPVITTPRTLPNAEAGKSYSLDFEATGAGAITWSSSQLPEGLTLTTSGNLRGDPFYAGTYSFRIRAENAFGATEDEFHLTVE